MHNIWIADDDEAIRMVLEEGLKSSELAITTFANGESLIEALNEDQPDLIISDIKMPGIHGYDLLKHIKNNHEKIPVIIMTAFTDMAASARRAVASSRARTSSASARATAASAAAAS